MRASEIRTPTGIRYELSGQMRGDGGRQSPKLEGPSGEVAVMDHPPIPAWKRTLDLGVIMLMAPFLMPVMLLTMVVIRSLSPGPIFFRQRRIGYAGREFDLLKFRTMKPGADVRVHSSHLDRLMESGTPMVKLDAHDSRVIPGGRILRATGLDELPQLLNVFQGHMSLVGPRPCLPYEYARYNTAQKRRFGSLPGLTGLWQVSGKNRLTFQEMIRLDVCYVETANLLLDLKILVKTPLAVWNQVLDTVRSGRIAKEGNFKSANTGGNRSVQG